jgi:hypothetical protein
MKNKALTWFVASSMILVFLLCLGSLLSPIVPPAKTRSSRMYAANHVAHPFPATNSILLHTYTDLPQVHLVSTSAYSFGTNTDLKRSIEEAERINAIQMRSRRQTVNPAPQPPSVNWHTQP